MLICLFTVTWEKRKLESFSKTTYGGGTPKTNVTEFWEGNIPWIQSSNLTNDDVQHIEFEKFISIKGLKNSAAKLIPENSITIVTRVGVGKLALVRCPFATSQDFLSLTDLTVNSQFAVYTIYNLLKKELNNIQGTSIKGITKKDLLSKNLLISLNFEEQEKIGTLFQSLDQLITVNQDRILILKKSSIFTLTL